MRAAGVNPLEPYPNTTTPWRCECMTCHEIVTPTLASVRNGRGGCLHCGHVKTAATRRGYNAMTAYDEMRDAGVEPLEEFPGRHKPWLCECLTCHQQVTPMLHSVRQGRGGCRLCGVAVRAGKRREDADTAEREMRAAGFNPIEPYTSSGQPWRVRCMDCGAEVTKRLSQIRAGSAGCSACGPNALIDPVAAVEVAEAEGFTPLVPYPGTTKEHWLMRCNECGREAEPIYNSLQQGKGCAYCNGKKVDADEARAVMLDAGLIPLVDFPGAASKQWLATCTECGRESRLPYSSVSRGARCAYCAGRMVDVVEARDLMREAGLEPVDGFPGSHEPWLCRCVVCGEEVSPSYGNIKGGATKGCAYCAGKMVKPEAAVHVMRAAGLEPLVEYPGALAPWLCRCKKCDEEVQPRYNNVQQGSGVCSNCAQGFSAIALSIVYLMAHPVFQALKIGIGNVGNDRVGWHQRDGWELLALVDTDTGDEARVIERSVLVAWREAGYPYGVDKADMPHRGYTETAPDSPDARRLAGRLLT
jgi:recombinational DNA repair protein (RecF pathway)